MKARIYPGSVWIACVATDLFGAHRVNVGTFADPVYVTNVSESEVAALKELLVEYGVSVEVEK